MKHTFIVLASGLGLAAMSIWLMWTDVDKTRDAQTAFQNGDYSDAVRSYQESAGNCSDLPRLAANQAAALYRLERFKDAESRYQLAGNSHDPMQSARAAYGRGNCAIKLACSGEEVSHGGLLDQAEEQYRACLDRDAAAAGGDAIFENARFNLELSKLLRQPSGSNVEPDYSANVAAADPRTGIRRAFYESRDESGPAAEPLAAGEEGGYLCPD
jgi:tetratricopeptide (TPR) repeat protein